MDNYNTDKPLLISDVKAGHRYFVANGHWDMYVTERVGNRITMDVYACSGRCKSVGNTFEIQASHIQDFTLYPYEGDDEYEYNKSVTYVNFEASLPPDEDGSYEILYMHGDLQNVIDYIKENYERERIHIKRVESTYTDVLVLNTLENADQNNNMPFQE